MNAHRTDTEFDRRHATAADATGSSVTAVGDDPVLEALDQAEGAYRAARSAWAREALEAQRARDELAAAVEARARAEEEVRRARAELTREREQTARHRDRADRLAAALKDVHRALFHGNVYDLILKACLSLTGATRGLYVAAQGDGFRVRAAADVGGYPKRPPSEFVQSLCRKVVADQQPLVTDHPADLAGVTPPSAADETFAAVLVAPAVLMGQFKGVVILADKPGGFDADDAGLVMSVGDQAAVALENRQLQDELLRAYFSVVAVLADAIEAKDAYTHGHSESVATLARQTAARLTDSDELRSVCCYGGLLHDIGKIGVSDGVLNKPGKLLPEEWTLMQSHVRIGRELLSHVPALAGVADVVMYHHERYDGAGYPAGLKGDQIPLAARIVGVVDAYSAMTARRSYKDSMTAAEARAELVRCKGTHFDPRVVDAFLQVLDGAERGDDCADACGLTLRQEGASEFHHALRLRGPVRNKRGEGVPAASIPA